jgi:hypothetical protein
MCVQYCMYSMCIAQVTIIAVTILYTSMFDNLFNCLTFIIASISHQLFTNTQNQINLFFIRVIFYIKGEQGALRGLLCPFAVYCLRYAVTSFFTISRISLADGKRAGQKVHRKIAIAVQKVKTPLLFVPLF